MGLKKLSESVGKKANSSVKKIILFMCVIAGIAFLFQVGSSTVNENRKQVELYTSQIDSTMAEKVAFINTVANGVSSGTVNGDMYAYVDQMVAMYNDVSAVYVCVKQDGVVYSDGIMTYMSGGWLPPDEFVVSGRSWYQGACSNDGVFISEPYVDEQSGGICITLAKSIKSGNEVIGVAGLDMYMDDLVKLIEASYDGGNYVSLVSSEGNILTHPNAELALTVEKTTPINEALNGKYKSIYENLLKNKVIFDYKGGLKLGIANHSELTGWTIVAISSLSHVFIVFIIIAIVAVIFGIVVSKIAKTALINSINPMFEPLEYLSENVSKITEGHLDYQFKSDTTSQEVYRLTESLNETVGGLRSYIDEISTTVTAISDKDLSLSLEGNYPGDFNQIKEALINIVDNLNVSLSEINNQAETVLEFSRNLAETSESVADSATSQSASVLQASEEMMNLTVNMEKIAEYAGAIKANTDETNDKLTIGSSEMKELVSAMEEIENCYSDIAGFIDEINNIARQTNLLSLNASIEAARAGEVGRGFAVVASEISSLSDSSSKSSAKISEAIARSQVAVDKGKTLVLRTEKTIEEGVVNSVKSVDMVNNIAGFVETQKKSASEISANIQSISDMVESNAASAQENSAISTQLGECAKALMDTIAEFDLKA